MILSTSGMYHTHIQCCEYSVYLAGSPSQYLMVRKSALLWSYSGYKLVAGVTMLLTLYKAFSFHGSHSPMYVLVSVTKVCSCTDCFPVQCLPACSGFYHL